MLKSRSFWIREKGKRLAMNTPIQGSAKDIMTLAELKCNPEPHPELMELGWYSADLDQMDVKMLLEVHDELVFECPESHAQTAFDCIREHMSTAMDGVRPFHCPLEVSGGIGNTWTEAGGK